jgi:hypothetical protein
VRLSESEREGGRGGRGERARGERETEISNNSQGVGCTARARHTITVCVESRGRVIWKETKSFRDRNSSPGTVARSA